MAPTEEAEYPMNGGDGLHSYTKNSSYQEGVIDASKAVIVEAVAQSLDLNTMSTPFRVADFGCSTGPNTFLAMQNIVEAVEAKYNSGNHFPAPEFHVFFNDHVSNDFNVLFRSLPVARKYLAAGVPGSFYSRVFPKSTLHFSHCSYALQWLSCVPEEIRDKNSPAYNKGRIHYTGKEGEENVVRAYFGQFKKDMEAFLEARALELVGGGLLVIIMPGLPNGETLFTRAGAGFLFQLLESSLMELVDMEIISEESVDSFNMPQYHPSMEELEKVIGANKSFSIEKAGVLSHPMADSPSDVQRTSLQGRAAMDVILGSHFGDKILDPLFGIFTRKLQENYHVFDKEIRKDAEFFLVLKRKFD